VAIGIPEAVLRAPLRHSLRLLLGAGVLALAISLGVAYALARRVLVPMRALARFAADPVRPPEPGSFGMLEVEAVAAALRHSLAERQAALEALQLLNESLEARVRHEIDSRERAQAMLAQAQRMEALGQLAGGIAHDFNNVLQAVTGGLSLIQRRADDPPAVRRLSGMAADAAGRGAAITGRLLTFARRGELQAVVIDPVGLLEGLREMLSPTLGAGIVVQVAASPGLPCLRADRAQLETVLVNLAVNARDAMPRGGTLTLSAKAEPAEGGREQPELKPGPYLRLALSDTGSGMDAAVLARASEPFFTTKGPGHGTGLGLAMARGFAQQSGGGLCIHSILGVGTEVALWFPQAEQVPAGDQQEEVVPPDPTLPKLRLLMVDDDSMVREVLAHELEDRGFQVVTASDGLSALALLDRGEPADVLVSDYAMPGMNGLTLIEEARRRRPDLPALLLTGYAEDEAGLAAAQNRLTVLLRKPVSGEELAARASLLSRLEPSPS
jgi:signal transduction histidine kinase